MTVELINHNPNEILDLTGGADAATDSQVQESTEPELDTTVEDEGVISTDEPTSTEENEPTEPSEDSDNSESTDSTDPVEGEFYFGETQVNVEVPDEIAKALTEAGIDQADLLGQLFKKDGDFSLDEDTKAKLEEKFGATMVNGYLNMYKTINEQAAQKFASDAQAQSELEKEQGEKYSAAVGGEEGLVLMEDYITKNFNDEQISAYNAVMESGDFASQMLIISQVKQMQDMASKLQNGDKNINLVGDKDAADAGVSTPMDKGYLSYDEYQEIILEDKYWEDSAYMQQVDSARIAGQRRNV